MAEELMDTIECGNCGETIPLNSKRCPNCGIDLFDGDFGTIDIQTEAKRKPSTKVITKPAKPQLNIDNKEPYSETQRVVVVDFDIPFWAMVKFLIKLSIAAVPAAIVVFIFWAVIGNVLITAIFGMFAALSR